MNDLCFEITTATVGDSDAVIATEQRATPFQQMLSARAVNFMPGTHTGINVNEETALRLAAVYSSIRIIAETIGSLPVEVFETNADGASGQTYTHPVAELLAVEPNGDQTPLVYAETTMQHVLGHGNTYSAINWSPRTGQPTELRHFHPSEVTVNRDQLTRELIYHISSETDGNFTLDASQMLHIPGFGNGIIGYSPVRYFAESIGLGLAQERFAGLYFGQGAKPNLIVETPGELSDEAFQSLQTAINTGFSADRAFGALLLEGGAKATAVSIPMNEAQLLESRNFSGRDISQRMFRIPPHISGYTDALKYDHVEQADLQFAKHCLRPWLIRREQEMRRKLFLPGQRGRFRVRHNLDALLRADLKTRYEAHKASILNAFGTINEAREHENLPPVPEGNRIIFPESVFGAQDSSREQDSRTVRANSAGMTQISNSSRELDQRLRAMTLQTLEGLLQREAVNAERHLGKANWNERCREFYEKHRQLIAERLELLEVDLTPVLAGIDQRASELSECTTADDLDELFARHADYLKPLVDQLLTPPHVEESES